MEREAPILSALAPHAALNEATLLMVRAMCKAGYRNSVMEGLGLSDSNEVEDEVSSALTSLASSGSNVVAPVASSQTQRSTRKVRPSCSPFSTARQSRAGRVFLKARGKTRAPFDVLALFFSSSPPAAVILKYSSVPCTKLSLHVA